MGLQLAGCSSPPGKGGEPDMGQVIGSNPCAVNNGGCDANATCSKGIPASSFPSEMPPVQPVCTCKPGYEGDGEICTAIDPCKVDNGGCSPNATCTNTGPGTNTCACNSGYTGDGKSCVLATGSCAHDNGGCDANATCTSTGPGTNSCKCNNGYSGDGKTCSPINSCTTNNGGCDANATCTSTGPGTNSCKCNNGYSGDGKTCIAVQQNPCATSNGDCGPNSTCSWDGHTVACACKPGFDDPKGDGKTCLWLPCGHNNGGCDVNANCIQPPTGQPPSCECKSGYTGNGKICEVTNPVCKPDSMPRKPIGSCLAGAGLCMEFIGSSYWSDPAGICTGTYVPAVLCDHNQTIGGCLQHCGGNAEYVAYYPPGGNAAKAKTICDTEGGIWLGNPCAINHGGCDVNATCTSTGPGANTCACNKGYTGDGKTCVADGAAG
jgi:hypothetical protein